MRRSRRPGAVEEDLMSNVQDQIWKGATFTIERRQIPSGDAVVFRFSGPFTARDMYSSLSPVALHNIFETAPPRPAPTVNIFDLTEVPYMDSCGLGLVIGHFVRCQNRGVRLIAAGVAPRVLDLFKTTKTDHLFPITTTVVEASRLYTPKAQ
jgi:anti-anti-sigma factor